MSARRQVPAYRRQAARLSGKTNIVQLTHDRGMLGVLPAQENAIVEQAGEESARQRAHPIDEVRGPEVCHHSRPERPRRIHGSAGQCTASSVNSKLP